MAGSDSSATSAGLRTGGLGCDGGAAEALARDRHEVAVAVYFDRRADAGDFLTLTASNGKENAGPFAELLRVTLDCAA